MKTLNAGRTLVLWSNYQKEKKKKTEIRRSARLMNVKTKTGIRRRSNRLK